ncbi:MerR family transcriptional regulator [Saccharospirillum alexandrii]|uniref:MerR family transcriptional regulator n=1 Tax=Saccharospirillum alexandrii TaxID=2448477 RepID=UPI000FDA5253|nr:helix-turn-helix domain-containing protein [Saccharospirillum alexandrii]
MQHYSIGQLAKRLNCAVQTLRYYESIGLVAPPHRTEGNQRRYSDAHLNQLRFIRHARELGFSLEAIKSLLRLSRHADEPCHEANAIAEEQLTAVRSRIARLQALEEELSRMVGVCEGNTVAHCRVIEVLENHALCLHDHDDMTPEKPLANHS